MRGLVQSWCRLNWRQRGQTARTLRLSLLLRWRQSPPWKRRGQQLFRSGPGDFPAAAPLPQTRTIPHCAQRGGCSGPSGTCSAQIVSGCSGQSGVPTLMLLQLSLQPNGMVVLLLLPSPGLRFYTLCRAAAWHWCGGLLGSGTIWFTSRVRDSCSSGHWCRKSQDAQHPPSAEDCREIIHSNCCGTRGHISTHASSALQCIAAAAATACRTSRSSWHRCVKRTM